MIKRNNIAKVTISIILALFFWTFICMNKELFISYTEKEVFQLGYFITALAASATVWLLGSFKIKLNTVASVICGSLAYAVSLFGAMQLSVIFCGGFEGLGYIYFLNLLFWFAFAALGLLIFGGLRSSAITALAASFVFNGSSYIIYCFRGTPLIPNDVFAWGTAMTVAGQYKFELTYIMITATVLTAALIMLAFKFPIRIKFRFSPLIMRAIGAVLLTASVGYIVTTDLSEYEILVFDQYMANHNYGSALSFYVSCTRMGLHKNEGYDAEALDEKLLSYDIEETEEAAAASPKPESTAQPKAAAADNSVKPNIVVIMNESFADFKTISDFQTNMDYMPFYHELEKNVIKGELLVSPFGGYTCNTEYEFLTGMSTGVLESQVAPYMQLILKRLPYSLPMHMRRLGYESIAIHPSFADNWNRSNVYKHLSFDKFYSIENFGELSEYPEHTRGLVNDRGNYGAIVNYFRSKPADKRAFIFNITMQNHGGYTYTNYPSKIFLENMEGDYPQTEQYLTLIKESDDALRYLLMEMKKLREPTIVLMFGDHMPNVETGFYEELYGKPLSELRYDEALSRYKIPFMIWANYNIPKEDFIYTSPCFLSNKLMEVAGLPKSRVQLYLDDLQNDVIQINPTAYSDADGVYHRHSEAEEVINEYYDMQYALLIGEKLNYDFEYDSADYEMLGAQVISPRFFIGNEYEKIKSANP